VLARTRTTFLIDGKDVTPAQLLERLGFPREHLSARIEELSGGQRRRLQLLLVLLEEPNVLILDEPTNDLDTDMLAALEDVLDSWPGTLLVVSHDRYFIERVTDQQYAVLGGRFRHLPGGVDEYLRVRASGPGTAVSPARPTGASGARAVAEGGISGPAPLGGAELRAAEKELAALERRIERLRQQAVGARAKLADLDQSDYQLLGGEMAKISALDDEAAALEERWLELSESLG